MAKTTFTLGFLGQNHTQVKVMDHYKLSTRGFLH
jgi:hypothetical protein